jgi:hypothetical protein
MTKKVNGMIKILDRIDETIKMSITSDDMMNKIEIQYGIGLLSRAHSFSISGNLIGGISPFSRHISGGTSSRCTYKMKE